MAYTTINKSTDYFNTKLYTGNGSTQSISSVGFQPDWVWLKGRSGTGRDHLLFDAIRGATNYIKSNATSAEATISSTLTSFDSDGFSIGSNSGINTNSETFVSWSWKANGSGSANTDGSISSTISANTTSGFSIVTYTSGGGSGTVGHGLNSVPKVMFYKPLSTSGGWDVYHHSLGISNRLNLHNTGASSAGYFQTLPTSSVFTEPNLYSGQSVIMYCFAEKKGFSKFGSYTGNGNADGAFVYTGFKPAFLLIRSVSTTNWNMFDNKRSAFNVADETLWSNSTDSEATVGTSYGIDILSNGFKARSTSSQVNFNNTQMVYMAFAEAPLVGSNNVPCTAR